MNTVSTKLKKDDKVKVITGKDKGKIGKILKVINKKSRVVVENINVVKSHQKPSMKNPQGGIIDKEAPVDFSNVMLMCNHCMSPVRIKAKTLEDGNKVRVCRKCNETIDI
ncbi:MAG: 50S ribosomal protein L24 [Proteobacteria bacterium]|nr:50S ribosomal protein L24 [Pseudomonadota bacterium]